MKYLPKYFYILVLDKISKVIDILEIDTVYFSSYISV